VSNPTKEIRAAVALVLALALGPSAEGRPDERFGDVWPIAIGSLVRMSAPSIGSGSIQGTVVEIDEQALLIRVKDGGRVRVPRETIHRVEVSLGTHGHALKGMAIGALVGGAVGAIDIDCKCPGSDHVAGAVGGAVGGLVIGALIRSDRWAPVPLERVHARAESSRRGPPAAMTFDAASSLH